MENNNRKYLSWNFIKKLAIILGVLGSLYLWLDAKLESKLDREDFKAIMIQQTDSLNKISLSQESVANELHIVDIRLTRIEDKIQK